MLDKRDFYKLLSKKNVDTDIPLDKIKKCLNRYPYFESLRFIYLKSLYAKDYNLFREELKKSAVLITNREELFYFIFEDDFKEFEKEKMQIEKNKRHTAFLIEAFFENTGEQADDILEIDKQKEENLASKDYLAFLHQSEKNVKKDHPKNHSRNQNINADEKSPTNSVKLNNKEKQEPVNIGEGQYIKDKTEENTSSELTLEPVYSIEELQDLDKKEKEYDAEPMKGQNLIDEFLAKEYLPLSGIKKEDVNSDKDFPIEQKNEENVESELFFTETLANIYIKQRRYDKAYKIIKHLSLNYPRKSIYFAEQLSFLEKLILNSKYNKK